MSHGDVVGDVGQQRRMVVKHGDTEWLNEHGSTIVKGWLNDGFHDG